MTKSQIYFLAVLLPAIILCDISQIPTFAENNSQETVLQAIDLSPETEADFAAKRSNYYKCIFKCAFANKDNKPAMRACASKCPCPKNCENKHFANSKVCQRCGRQA